MQKKLMSALILSLACSAATAIEPLTKEEVYNDLGRLMYEATYQAAGRSDRDIQNTSLYRSVVWNDDPQRRMVWNEYFEVAQKALDDGEDAVFAALLTKTYCIKVN